MGFFPFPRLIFILHPLSFILRWRRAPGLMLLALALFLGVGVVGTARADQSAPMYTLRQRFGVNVIPAYGSVPAFPGRITDYAGVGELGFGWYSDWTVRRNPVLLPGMEFAQLVQTRAWPPSWDLIREAILANPGSLWIIGNEPETRGQGEHTPAEYAMRYHDAYEFIKGTDPMAQVAIGGVVMPSPLRLKWLDLCMAYYQSTFSETMPIDVWNIHVQILQEKRDPPHNWGCGVPFGLSEAEGRLYTIVDNCNVELFKQLSNEFCLWLAEHGERQKPLIISEFGVLMPSDYIGGDQAVLSFMESAFRYLLDARDSRLGYAADEGRLVQRWMWFSLNFPSHDPITGLDSFNGALYEWQHPDRLTVLGERYRDFIRRESLPYKQFLPQVRGAQREK